MGITPINNQINPKPAKTWIGIISQGIAWTVKGVASNNIYVIITRYIFAQLLKM